MDAEHTKIVIWELKFIIIRKKSLGSFKIKKANGTIWRLQMKPKAKDTEILKANGPQGQDLH